MALQERWKSYALQRETTESSKDSLKLHPFSKSELLLKERIRSQSEQILSLMAWLITFTTIGDLPWMLLFYYANA